MKSVPSHRASILWAALALLPACDRAPTRASAPPPSATPAVIASAPPADAGPRVEDAGLACKPRAGAIKLLWRDEDAKVALDGEAFACLSEAERAAVGYVSALGGTECDWKPGGATKPGGLPEHMECKLTTALGLGFQCEADHKRFLEGWLGDDLPATCARVPITAFHQTALDELSITHDGATIVVAYKAITTEGPGADTWRWSETIGFAEKGPRALKIAYKKPVGKR